MKKKVINSFFEVMNQCLVIRITEDLDHHRVMALREEADSLIEKETEEAIGKSLHLITLVSPSRLTLELESQKKKLAWREYFSPIIKN